MQSYLRTREIIRKKQIESEYEFEAVMRCENNHMVNGVVIGYCPHIVDGTCRFCTKTRPLSFAEYLHINSGGELKEFAYLCDTIDV